MINGHLLGLYEKALVADISWKERLQTAKSLGYDFVEISIDEADDRLARLYWDVSQIQALKAVIKETGIPLRSMCLSGHRRFPFGSADPKIREKAHDIMERAILFAKDLDIEIIQLAGYDVYYEKSTDESKRMFLEGMKWSARLAEKYQVMLAMEIMDTPFMNSITKHLWYEQQIASPYYKVYPDLGNLSAWPENNVLEELEKGRASIVQVHLKDTLKVTDTFPGKFKCVPFGTGCVDFPACFTKLESMGYKGAYMMEMWNDPAADNIAGISKAKAYIEEQYKKAIGNA